MAKNFISNKDETVRMFKNGFLEKLSHIHYSVPLFIFLPVIGYFGYKFHWLPPGKIGARLHFIFHGVHHDYPSDSKRLVMVPTVSIPLSALFFYLFKLAIGPVLVAPFFMGFLAGYLFYDMVHYAIHHYNFKSKFWLNLKHHHMLHHYKDMDHGYGVSSKIWDYIFRSDFKKSADQ